MKTRLGLDPAVAARLHEMFVRDTLDLADRTDCTVDTMLDELVIGIMPTQNPDGRDLATLRLRQWAHALGFRGHWSTRSRRYSTTFTALRRARVVHAIRRRLRVSFLDPDTYRVVEEQSPAGAEDWARGIVTMTRRLAK